MNEKEIKKALIDYCGLRIKEMSGKADYYRIIKEDLEKELSTENL